MKKALIIAVSSLNLLGCAVDATDSTEVAEPTKVPLVTHADSDKIVLVGVFDDEALTVRISSEFSRYVRSMSAVAPSVIIGDTIYSLGDDDIAAVGDEVSVGETLDVTASDDHGAPLRWKLHAVTPEAAAEAGAQTQLPMELVFCN